MKYRKTVVSLLIWVIASFALMASFVQYATILGGQLKDVPPFDVLFSKLPQNALVLTLLVSLILILITAVLYCLFYFSGVLVRHICGKKKKADHEDASMVFPELIGMFFTVAAFLFIRYEILISASLEGLETEYYKMAMITNDSGPVLLDHTGSFFYVSILSFVLSFLGNKVFAACLLQLVFQTVTLIFLYFAVRNVAGRGTAFWMTLILAVLPEYANKLLQIDPSCLIFLLFSIGLFAFSIYLSAKTQEGLLRFAQSILIGIVFGALIYVDLSAVLLPIFLIFVLLIWTGEMRQKEWVQDALIVLVVTFLSLVGILWLDGFSSGDGLEPVLDTWADLVLMSNIPQYLYYQNPLSLIATLQAILVTGVALFSIPRFFRRSNHAYLMFSAGLILFPGMLSRWGIVSDNCCGLFLFALMAGAGLAAVFVRNDCTELDRIIKTKKNEKEYIIPEMPKAHKDKLKAEDGQQTDESLDMEQKSDSGNESQDVAEQVSESGDADLISEDVSTDVMTEETVDNSDHISEDSESTSNDIEDNFNDSSDDTSKDTSDDSVDLEDREDSENSDDSEDNEDSDNSEDSENSDDSEDNEDSEDCEVAENPESMDDETQSEPDHLDSKDEGVIVYDGETGDFYIPPSVCGFGTEEKEPAWVAFVEENLRKEQELSEQQKADLGTEDTAQTGLPEGKTLGQPSASITNSSDSYSGERRDSLANPAKGILSVRKEIPNPLPLPKKSEKRASEFPFDIPEDLMHFDFDDEDEDDPF